MFEISVDDYDFDAETVANKRTSLKFIFGLDTSRIPAATVHVMYDMQYVIHRENLPEGMKAWLQSLVSSLDWSNNEIRQELEGALASARKNSEFSGAISDEGY